MLNGQKIHLRAPVEGDVGALYEIASELETWEERNPSPPRLLSRAEYAERYTAALTTSSEDKIWFVIEGGGGVAGRCDLFGMDSFHHSGEVGVALHPSARGKGWGTDALRVLVRFAFERRNLHRVHLTALASNAAGLACYRKVGFVEEGRLRESSWVRGGYEDEVLMGLLRPEWRASLG
jgi:RimJ/RimL family protein N-acetyltransferase